MGRNKRGRLESAIIILVVGVTATIGYAVEALIGGHRKKTKPDDEPRSWQD